MSLAEISKDKASELTGAEDDSARSMANEMSIEIPIKLASGEIEASPHMAGQSETLNYTRAWDVSTAGENDSLSKCYNMVGAGSTVLDIGCSIGQLGAELRQKKNCIVYGIEYNQEAADAAARVLDKVYCLDVQALDFLEFFPEKRFDTIIFADVLEHLSNPVEVLRKVSKVLNPGGSVVISLPNVAHASVRLSLMQGRFDYRDEGLLDRTHLHFYTRAEVRELLRSASLLPVEVDRTYLGARDTEIPIHVGGIITEDLIKTVELEPDGTTYQFIIKAVPVADESHLEMLDKRLYNLEISMQQAAMQTTQLEAALVESNNVKTSLQSEVDKLNSDLFIVGVRLTHIEQEAIVLRKQTDELIGALSVSQEILGKQEQLLAELTQKNTDITEATLYVSKSVQQLLQQRVQPLEARTQDIAVRIHRYTNVLPLRALRKLRRMIFRL